MNLTERRVRFRAVLGGDQCIYPAPVFDAMSARIADNLGFEIAWMAQVASDAAELGSPPHDLLALLTLSELTQRVRGICRASSFSLLVEAHNGYGNALNVMRTVEELENAGASALTIEDNVLPIGPGSAESVQFVGGRTPSSKDEQLISLEEGIGKMKAALAARQDSSLVIVARTPALGLRVGGIPETIRRVKAYEKVGVDAINLARLQSMEQLEAIHAETNLPLIIGGHALVGDDKRPVSKRLLVANGLRIQEPRHLSLFAAMKAEYDILKALRDGKEPAELWPTVASGELIAKITQLSQYEEWFKTFCGAG